MNLFCNQLIVPFKAKKVIKLISGLNNLDIDQILALVKCAEVSNATYIDISANPRIISLIKSFTNLPICVSSIDPLELYNSVLAGADLVEIGNFDFFYKKNISFSSFKILQLAMKTRKLITNKDICVTIPYTLNLWEQIDLAQKLENIGINILQTESYNSKYIIQSPINISKNSKIDNLSKSIDITKITLSSTYALSHFVNIPIITSSKMNCLSSPMAYLYGASGIGLGTFVCNKNSLQKKSLYINEISNSINLNNRLNQVDQISILSDRYKAISYK
uniref:Uncharacterized protein ycf23 n=1 Tax=Taenioma perpusillum TaxID=210852 RepID=A0A1Z1MQV4_9FLOR|nr:hypothetical protein [Taenioma perpusillum]ARW68458.1 hypothetical protein [Taenioma perpusillum]